MLYSVKMRSAQGGAHEFGGRHISGAERILPGDQLDYAVLSMLHRAREHERGCADFISLKVEEIKPQEIIYKPLLAFSTCKAATAAEGHRAAIDELVRAGVSINAAARGLAMLNGLTDSMRGAMVLDAESGLRIDGMGERGVRASKMDCVDSRGYDEYLQQTGLTGDHVREALVLASKVAGAKGMVAELCWSDDPNYVTGYVASPVCGYRRIPVMKERGNGVGGRIFFVRSGTDVAKLINYLEEQVVLIKPQEALTC